MIRRATPDDVPTLIQLGECARRESRTHFPPIDQGQIDGISGVWFSRPDLCLALIAERGEPAGFLLASMAGWPWTRAQVAVIYTAYVLPQHRGLGGLMIRYCLRWAKEYGALDVRLNLESGIDDEQASKLLKRMGFEETGMGYRKVL